MADAETLLLARARRAYERGRLLLGLRTAALVAPMAGLSLFACGRPAATLADAGALVLVVAACVWHGLELRRGARLGLLAGVPPLVFPILLQATGHVCGSDLCALYPLACVTGGLLGGSLIGTLARRNGLGASGVAAAALTGALTGTLGCLLAGVSGLIALGLGLALGAVPTLALKRT